MADKDVDSLLAELYPDEAKKLGVATKNGKSSAPVEPKTIAHDFDDDGSPTHRKQAEQPKKVVAGEGFDDEHDISPQKVPANSNGTTKKKSGNGFDDSDDDEDSGAHRVVGSSTHHHHHHGTHAHDHVEFPRLPNVKLLEMCHRRCTLTNSATSAAPCPYIRCIQCDYLIVRCPEPAQWLDKEGTTNLYLAMRYHYPDWRKFGTDVLTKGVSGSAAYCCQCTWFTCEEPDFGIETPLGALKFNRVDNHLSDPVAHCTSSAQAKAGSKKPLPRWLCSGHPPM